MVAKEYSVGILETNSIALGIEAVDAMLKIADVELIDAHPICPGKYLVVLRGEVGSIEVAIAEGKKTAGSTVVDTTIIPRIHNEVFVALAGAVPVDFLDAVGVLETFSCACLIRSADAAVKEAEVTLVEARLATGIGGKAFLVLTGKVGPVRDAMAAAEAEAKSAGLLHSSIVIPDPHPQLKRALF
ncbi:MAG: BMC domain-containing protein [Candidatus Lindowbacteria bacterium]|nr:BMC domain-containing protein [Candidatus Lindowbacteria bacterium]